MAQIAASIVRKLVDASEFGDAINNSMQMFTERQRKMLRETEDAMWERYFDACEISGIAGVTEIAYRSPEAITKEQARRDRVKARTVERHVARRAKLAAQSA